MYHLKKTQIDRLKLNLLHIHVQIAKRSWVLYDHIIIKINQ